MQPQIVETPVGLGRSLVIVLGPDADEPVRVGLHHLGEFIVGFLEPKVRNRTEVMHYGHAMSAASMLRNKASAVEVSGWCGC